MITNVRWRRLTDAFSISAACAIGFAAVAMMVDANRVAAFDHAVIAAVQGWEGEPLTSVLHFFTWLGAGLPVGIITLAAAVFLYGALGHRKELVLLLAVVVGTGALNYLLKLLFQRERPMLYRIAEANGYSFPSGHSMVAFGLYGIMAYLLWKHIPRKAGRLTLIAVSTLFILTIGLSRIYLGVHYPSDVIGGYLASGCWMFAWIAGYGRKIRSHPSG